MSEWVSSEQYKHNKFSDKASIINSGEKQESIIIYDDTCFKKLFGELVTKELKMFNISQNLKW